MQLPSMASASLRTKNIGKMGKEGGEREREEKRGVKRDERLTGGRNQKGGRDDLYAISAAFCFWPPFPYPGVIISSLIPCIIFPVFNVNSHIFVFSHGKILGKANF